MKALVMAALTSLMRLATGQQENELAPGTIFLRAEFHFTHLNEVSSVSILR